jgi:uncharacterized protein (TIGR03067 family)
MRLPVLLAAWAVLLWAGAVFPQPCVPGEVGRLRGEWRLVATRDERRTDPAGEQIHMVIRSDGRVLLKAGGQTTHLGVLRLGLSAEAKLLDLELANGQTVRGVYELKGDELFICCDVAGRPRPAGLEPTGSQWVERWQRVRP